MWILMFLSSASCLFRFAQSGLFRRHLTIMAFAGAYAASLLLPHATGDSHWWRSTWLLITGILLPLRVGMVVDASKDILRPMPERAIVVEALACASGATVLLTLTFMTLSWDFTSLVAARQYLQIAMMVWFGMLLLYGWLRDNTAIEPHALILFVVLVDYAVAASFDASTGLSQGFFVITPGLWRTVKVVSNIILALCFLGWAATAKREPDQPSGERYQEEGRYAAESSHVI